MLMQRKAKALLVLFYFWVNHGRCHLKWKQHWGVSNFPATGIKNKPAVAVVCVFKWLVSSGVFTQMQH